MTSLTVMASVLLDVGSLGEADGGLVVTVADKVSPHRHCFFSEEKQERELSGARDPDPAPYDFVTKSLLWPSYWCRVRVERQHKRTLCCLKCWNTLRVKKIGVELGRCHSCSSGCCTIMSA